MKFYLFLLSIIIIICKIHNSESKTLFPLNAIIVEVFMLSSDTGAGWEVFDINSYSYNFGDSKVVKLNMVDDDFTCVYKYIDLKRNPKSRSILKSSCFFEDYPDLLLKNPDVDHLNKVTSAFKPYKCEIQSKSTETGAIIFLSQLRFFLDFDTFLILQNQYKKNNQILPITQFKSSKVFSCKAVYTSQLKSDTITNNDLGQFSFSVFQDNGLIQLSEDNNLIGELTNDHETSDTSGSVINNEISWYLIILVNVVLLSQYLEQIRVTCVTLVLSLQMCKNV